MPETIQTCPVCRKELPVQEAAFCPYCGASLLAKGELPPQVRPLLDAAAQTGDPVKKHELLLKAQQECPDCLAVERELLHLGRLYQRNPKRPSFDIIKCYLLHFYLTPREFPEERKAAMRRELFEDEQLQRCQRLAPDAEAFTRGYLERLSGDFIQLFLEGSSRYTNSIFGISLSHNLPKQMAAPAADMLRNIWADAALPADRRALLAGAFYRAFSTRMNGETDFLRARLEAMNTPVPE